MYTQLIQTFSPHIPHVPSLSAPVRRAHWEKYWTGDRPPILSGASEVMSRWTLFNLGAHIDGPESALNFYAGVSMWAAGNAPRSVYRAVSYTHLTLPTILRSCRSRWSPYH